jgi:hypothetical protein
MEQAQAAAAKLVLAAMLGQRTARELGEWFDTGYNYLTAQIVPPPHFKEGGFNPYGNGQRVYVTCILITYVWAPDREFMEGGFNPYGNGQTESQGSEFWKDSDIVSSVQSKVYTLLTGSVPTAAMIGFTSLEPLSASWLPVRGGVPYQVTATGYGMSIKSQNAWVTTPFPVQTPIYTQPGAWRWRLVEGEGPPLALTPNGEQVFFEASQPSGYAGMRTSTRFVDFPTMAQFLDYLSPSSAPKAMTGCGASELVKLLANYWSFAVAPLFHTDDIAHSVYNLATSDNPLPAGLSNHFPLSLDVAAAPVINAQYVSLSWLASQVGGQQFAGAPAFPNTYRPELWDKSCAVIPVLNGALTTSALTARAAAALEYPFLVPNFTADQYDDAGGVIGAAEVHERVMGDHRIDGPRTHVLFVEIGPNQPGSTGASATYQLVLHGGTVLVMNAAVDVNITGNITAFLQAPAANSLGTLNEVLSYVCKSECDQSDWQIALQIFANMVQHFRPTSAVSNGTGLMGIAQSGLATTTSTIAPSSTVTQIYRNMFDSWGSVQYDRVAIQAGDASHYRIKLRPAYLRCLVAAGMMRWGKPFSALGKEVAITNDFVRRIWMLSESCAYLVGYRLGQLGITGQNYNTSASALSKRLWMQTNMKWIASYFGMFSDTEPVSSCTEWLVPTGFGLAWYSDLTRPVPMYFSGKDVLYLILDEIKTFNADTWVTPSKIPKRLEGIVNAGGYLYKTVDPDKPDEYIDSDYLLNWMAWIDPLAFRGHPVNSTAITISATGVIQGYVVPCRSEWHGITARRDTFKQTNPGSFLQGTVLPLGLSVVQAFLGTDVGGATYPFFFRWNVQVMSMINGRDQASNAWVNKPYANPTLYVEDRFTERWIQRATASIRPFPKQSGTTDNDKKHAVKIISSAADRTGDVVPVPEGQQDGK